MRVVFLDIDGVLNVYTGDPSFPLAFSRDAVKALRRILVEADARIVISSTWRIFDLSREGWAVLLKSHGLGVALNRVVGKTRMDKRTLDPERERDTRPMQVRDWLKAFEADVESAVVLDDDCEDYGPIPFICVNSDVGLTDADATRAIEILMTRAAAQH